MAESRSAIPDEIVFSFSVAPRALDDIAGLAVLTALSTD
jgi:hypothetical protein